MTENRGGTGGGASRQGDGDEMTTPGGAGTNRPGSPGESGGMRAPSGRDDTPQRAEEDSLGSRTDRGNQNDEGIGSSASRGGGVEKKDES